MLEKQTKYAYQSMINDKSNEKKKCEILRSKLKGLKKNIADEIREWEKSFKKNNQCEATKDVIKKGRFEGKNAGQVKKLYHGRVSHMNSKYMGKVLKVCDSLDTQISNIDDYIEQLEKGIAKIQNQMDSMEE